jgi:hypothetical protein
MSKKENYIIVVGGVIFICCIIVFGLFRFFLYPKTDLDTAQQVLEFVYYVLPSAIAAGFLMARILNLEEKKELKKATELANKYAEENAELYKKNIELISKVDARLTAVNKKTDQNAKDIKGFEKVIEEKIERHIDEYHK